MNADTHKPPGLFKIEYML